MADLQASSSVKAVIVPNKERMRTIKAALNRPKKPPKNLSIAPPPDFSIISLKDNITIFDIRKTTTKTVKKPPILRISSENESENISEKT